MLVFSFLLTDFHGYIKRRINYFFSYYPFIIQKVITQNYLREVYINYCMTLESKLEPAYF